MSTTIWMKGDPELLHPSIETPQPQAPDFTLHSTPDETVSLHDFRGQPVILAFYSADWSPVSSDEMTLYHELMPEILRLQAELLSIFDSRKLGQCLSEIRLF